MCVHDAAFIDLIGSRKQVMTFFSFFFSSLSLFNSLSLVLFKLVKTFLQQNFKLCLVGL